MGPFSTQGWVRIGRGLPLPRERAIGGQKSQYIAPLSQLPSRSVRLDIYVYPMQHKLICDATFPFGGRFETWIDSVAANYQKLPATIGMSHQIEDPVDDREGVRGATSDIQVGGETAEK